MTTDEEKSRLLKLLQGLEPEVDVTRRCYDLVKIFKEKFGKEIEEEESEMVGDEPEMDMQNPYVVDEGALEETNRKLEKLARLRNRKGSLSVVIQSEADPKRPWRTNSHKEKLLRIQNELKRHREKDSDAISPLEDTAMSELVNECRRETTEAPPVSQYRLRDTVDAARKNLPNFKYKKVENTTATVILPEAHEISVQPLKEEINSELAHH